MAGTKPQKHTPADRRLKRNRNLPTRDPKAGEPKSKTPSTE